MINILFGTNPSLGFVPNMLKPQLNLMLINVAVEQVEEIKFLGLFYIGIHGQGI